MKSTSIKLLFCFSLLFAALSHSAPTLEESIKKLAQEKTWLDKMESPVITRQSLIHAIEMGRSYYLNHQKPEGNFIYALDIENGEIIDKDNQVRQAGALWGLSCLNRDRFNEPTRRAVLLGIDFFESQVQTLPTGEKCFVYPNENAISTGAVALFCLSLTEFLYGQEKYLDEKVKAKYRSILDTHLEFLRSMEMKNGSWARAYDVASGFRENNSSPYYDGEALLAYCKMARYLGYTNLIERINYSLPLLAKKYTVDSWSEGGDVNQTKGFYQWGCMAFAEYGEAAWTPHGALAKDAALALSWWIIHENQLAHRLGNTSYAIEGLIGAWRLTKLTGDTENQKKLGAVIEQIMSKLMTWQYKGPFMKFNEVLSAIKKAPPSADGGITYSKADTMVRIDVQQHQMHAMLLMLKYMFPK